MKTIIWCRGSIGDLLIHFSIVKHLQEIEHKNVVEIVLSSDLKSDIILELLSMNPFFDDKKIVIAPKSLLKSKMCDEGSIQKIKARWKEEEVEVFCLNHIKEIKKDLNHDLYSISKADDLVPYLSDIHYDNLSYLPVKPSRYSNSLKNYVLIFPAGNSNILWRTNEVLAKFKTILEYIINETDMLPILMGTELEINRYYGENADVLNMVGTTSLSDAVNLINNSRMIFTYDNGMKNFAFISPAPTMVVYNMSWNNTHPIEAWFPRQLQERPTNRMTTISSEFSEISNFVEEFKNVRKD